MTAKQYLSQIKILDSRIDQRLQEREALMEKATSTGSRELKKDIVQTSIDGDKVSRVVDRYLDMEKEITQLIDRFIDLKHKIIGEIQMLDDYRYEQILYLKYIKYMRLEEIACTMKKPNGDMYSFDHIAALHGEALKRFANIIEIP